MNNLTFYPSPSRWNMKEISNSYLIKEISNLMKEVSNCNNI